MLANLGWLEILVLVIVALFFIGPERLPDTAEYVAKGLRQARQWLADIQEQINETVDDDIKEEIRSLQKPVQEIAKIRAMGPRAAAAHYLLDSEDGDLLRDMGVDLSASPQDMVKKAVGWDTFTEAATPSSTTTPQTAHTRGQDTTVHSAPQLPAVDNESPALGITVNQSAASPSEDEIDIIVDD